MTTIPITPTLVQAIRAWNSDIARARPDYGLAPIRSCSWVDHDKPCHLMRRDDPTYCAKHRRAATKKYARLTQRRRDARARRRAAA